MVVPTNNIYSYNLSFVNLHNNSSFEFSVNICNFDTKAPIKVMNEKDLSSMYINKSDDIYNSGDYNQSTSWKSFDLKDLIPQFTNYDIAKFF